MKRLVWSATLVVAVGCTHLDPLETKTVALSRTDKSVVFVPVYGPKADKNLTAVAGDLIEANKKIQDLNRTRSPVDERVFYIASQMRDEAVDEVDLAIRVSNRTSGFVDVGRAREKADALKSVFYLRKPDKVLVDTDIQVSPNGTAQFMTMAQHKEGGGFWESYTPRSVMRIGQYMFRVGSCMHLEPVLVLEDPTKKTIQSPCP